MYHSERKDKQEELLSISHRFDGGESFIMIYTVYSYAHTHSHSAIFILSDLFLPIWVSLPIYIINV